MYPLRLDSMLSPCSLLLTPSQESNPSHMPHLSKIYTLVCFVCITIGFFLSSIYIFAALLSHADSA